MKKFIYLFIICLLSTTLSFGQNQTPQTCNPKLKIMKDSIEFKKHRQQLEKFNDKLNLYGFDQFKDSLKAKNHISPDLLKKWQERNKQPLDTTQWRNFPRTPKMPQLYKTDSVIRHYITRAELDNMPIYVPERGYIPNMKVESNDNMPVKKFDKKEKEIPSSKHYLLK